MNYKGNDDDDVNKKKTLINNKNIYNLYNTNYENQDDDDDDYDYYIESKKNEEKDYEKTDNIVDMYNELMDYCKSYNLNICEYLTIDVLSNYISHLEKS
jgi:hypothetical protein